MADVQIENGFTKIANEILENVAKVKLSPTQYRIILIIWRYTYGFGRTEHELSLSFLSKATGLDQRNIQRALIDLEEKRVITQNVKNGVSRRIAFVKDYDKWQLPLGEINKGQTYGETDKGTLGETNKGTYGETNKEERKSKEKYKETRKQVFEDTSNYFLLAKYFFDQIKNNNPNHKKPKLQNWANDIRLMIERDNRKEDDIKHLMHWVQQDEFEMANVLSPSKLRLRFDQLWMKAKPKQNSYIKQEDHRDREIEFQKFVQSGGDPAKYDWSL